MPTGVSPTARSGSVLILVVVLLVLMALIGTAYISTTRIDRYSAGQHMANVQSDLASDAGVTTLVQSAIVGGLYSDANPPVYRSGTDVTYKHYDSPVDDSWLASRIPLLPNPGANPTTPTGGNAPYWRFISLPPMLDSGTTPAYQFWSPWAATPVLSIVPANASAWKTQACFFPTAKVFSGSTASPALYVSNFGATWPPAPAGNPLPAADADGDGIADSLFFKLPGGPIDGVTYYAATRILDNNSAVNVNTAWCRDYDFTGAGTFYPNSGFFFTNLGLVELFRGYTATGTNYSSLNAELLKLDQGIGSWTGRWNGTSIMGLAGSNPVGEVSSRIDFNFLTWGDALQSQLGRRIDNPGPNSSLIKRYQPLSFSEGLNLASGFCIRNPQLSSSILDTALNLSLGSAKTTPYDAAPTSTNSTDKWYNENFNYETNPFYPAAGIRAFLTTRNPVSNLTPTPASIKNMGMAQSRAMPTPAKTCINTAPFQDLWRAFASVMLEPTATPDVPAIVKTLPGPAQYAMFRSPLRNTAAKDMSPLQTLQLRSALAAVNAECLRQFTAGTTNSADVISHKIRILADSTCPAYDVVVYGVQPQLYITEALLDVDNAQNAYVAIELHNPSAAQSIKLDGCQLALLDRSATPPMTLTPLVATLTGTVAGGGYAVLVSADPPPVGSQIAIDPAATPKIVVPDLTKAFDKELVLLRPRRADGTLTSGTDFNESNLWDLVPVDQLDCTGVSMPAMGTPRRYSYIRPNQAPTDDWKFVHPGPYDKTASPRLGGWTPISVTPTVPPYGSLGLADSAASATYTTKVFQIPLASDNWPMPWKVPQSPNCFPFGIFARNTDMLMVPFIGAYRVNTVGVTNQMIELNSVTMDSVYAEDTLVGDSLMDDSYEQVGRFCPLKTTLPDLNGTSVPSDPYGWASRLFDYLAVQSPADDYLPNVEPGSYLAAAGKVPEAVANVNSTIKNADSTNPNNATEDAVPIHGLVNINTAPWKVLAMLPMIPNGSGGMNVPVNEALARAIAYYRDVDDGTVPGQKHPHGSFKSIFELNQVWDTATGATGNTFQNAWATLPPTVTATWGVMSPSTSINGFERRFLVLNRISNLITTRSDSFTCYVLIQGWLNAGTPQATLASQRRMAFVLDRSSVTQTNKTPKRTNIPAR